MLTTKIANHDKVEILKYINVLKYIKVFRKKKNKNINNKVVSDIKIFLKMKKKTEAD